MAIFNDEAKWRDFLAKSVKNGIEISPENEQVVHIGKMRKDIVLMKHFFTKENTDTIIREVALENGLNEEGTEKLLMVRVISFKKSTYSFRKIILKLKKVRLLLKEERKNNKKRTEN